ncbi:MAG: type II toxin-antitoxin system HicA family toxin [Lachnospiraceae bacterium]|nr:type II toxin-antitoxin system HicA family toxin [Ruminococcus sp.]MCM1274325.1 type II toxin-antitoxin system HicA family toxin [Lachnospiraceae bacterium]
MGQSEKLLLKLLSGTNDNSFRFSELQRLLEILGFKCRIRGDHFIYTMDGVEEIINLQPVGNKAKPYQVKQVRNLVLKYTLGGDLLCINMK